MVHHPTPMSNCYEFYRTMMSTSSVYLYDGDGLCYCNNEIGVIFDFYTDFKRMKAVVPMIKYYCDICEKEIFNKNNIYEVKLFKKDNDYYGSIKKDICEDCYNKIKDILKKKN